MMDPSNKPTRRAITTQAHTSMSDTGQSIVRSIPLRVFAVNSDSVLIVEPTRSIVEVIPRACLPILEQTTHPDRIAGHIDTICQSLRLAQERRDAIRSVITILLSKRLIEPVDGSEDLVKASSYDDQETRDSGQHIEALAVPTKNRPHVLLNSLSSHLSLANNYGRTISVTVVDDSTSPDLRSSTIASLSNFKRNTGAPVEYIGRRERLQFADQLAKQSGVRRSVIEFGVLGDADGHAPGASRNFLLLYLLGKRFVSFDDDVFSYPVLPPKVVRDLTLSSVADPLETWVFSSQSEIDKSFPSQQVDMIGSHQFLLGQSSRSLVLNACRRFGIQTIRLTEEFARAVATGVRLPVTFSGVSGDSGKWSNRYYFSLDGKSFDRLVASREQYESAIATRYALRSVASHTISSGPYAMGPNISFDHERLLPPFLPNYISEDGVFGVLLRECFSEEYALGFCPFAVSHRPPHPRKTSRADFERTSVQMRVADIVNYLIQSLDLSSISGGERRLVEVGERLRDVSSGSSSAFEQFVEQVVSSSVRDMLHRISSHIEFGSELPQFFVEDLRRYRDALNRELKSRRISVPIDIDIRSNRSESLELLRIFVLKFARLLIAWPSLVASVRDLQREDGRFCERL